MEQVETAEAEMGGNRMSGIYIPGIEMPTSCAKCRLFNYEYGCPFIGAVGYALTKGKRNEDCPLVPVPDHGRLIDADDMSEKDNKDFSVSIGTAVGFAAKQLMIMAHAQLQEAIEIQPTIVPADKEGKEGEG